MYHNVFRYEYLTFQTQINLHKQYIFYANNIQSKNAILFSFSINVLFLVIFVSVGMVYLTIYNGRAKRVRTFVKLTFKTHSDYAKVCFQWCIFLKIQGGVVQTPSPTPLDSRLLVMAEDTWISVESKCPHFLFCHLTISVQIPKSLVNPIDGTLGYKQLLSLITICIQYHALLG